MNHSSANTLQRWRAEAGRNWVFFRQWLRAPLRTASVVPSSPRLGRAMALALPADVRRVVELGAGTGAITRALLQHRLQAADLFVLELNPELHAGLKQEFPGASVVCGDARELPQLLRRTERFSDGQTDAVVSSLGFLSMPEGLVEAIVAATLECLPAHGCIVQFTYGPKCPIPAAIMERFQLQARRVDFTLLNLPPASVYLVQRRSAARAG